MQIVIDYETDPDFSIHDEPEPGCIYVALMTLLYDANGNLVGSLGNSVFYENGTDWTIGTFRRVEDIPADCPHLREVAAGLIADYQRTRPAAPKVDYVFYDLDGVEVEHGTADAADAAARAARFIEAQADGGLSGTVEFNVQR